MIEADILKLFNDVGCETLPTNIEIDGKKKRVELDTHDKKKSLEYEIGFVDTEESLCYHVKIRNYKTGDFVDKILYPEDLEQVNIDAIKEEFQERTEKAKAETLIRQETAAIESQRSFRLADEHCDYPTDYMKQKRCILIHGARVRGETLIIPIRDMSNKIWSVQWISTKGKYMMKGSKIRGNFFIFGDITPETKTLVFCEGWATGATIHELLCCPVVVCFSAMNLKPVAIQFKEKYPSADLVIASDADEVGVSKGRSAARAVSGRCYPPPFKSPHPEYTDWNDYAEIEGRERAMMKLMDYPKEDKELTKQEWMQEWMVQHRVEINYVGVVRVFGEISSADQIMRQLHLDQDKEFRKVAQNLITSFVMDWLDERHKELFKELIKPLFETSSIPITMDDPLQHFVEACTGEINQADYTVLKHFIWQVKRKIKGLSIQFHMMPVFIGKTEGGKSVAVERLLEPVKDINVHSAMTACGDKGQWDIFSKFPVVFMDEMAGAAKTDMNSMKQLITASQLTFRAPYDRKSRTVPNISTLIGTSNESLQEIVRDTTSNRRFYPIECQDRLDWDSINALNKLALWQNVSHLEECPLEAHHEEVRRIQEANRNKSPVELWLEDNAEEPVSACITPSAKLFENFKDWKDQNGMEKSFYSSMKFGLELKRLGFKKHKRSDKNYWTLKLRGIDAISE